MALVSYLEITVIITKFKPKFLSVINSLLTLLFGVRRTFTYIYRNEDFWATITTQAHCLFQHAILPELVAKYYSRRGPEIESSSHPVVSSAASKNPDDEVWCSCREKEHGRMVACYNSKCSIIWFHYACVGIKRKPKGKWYCPHCTLK